MACHIDTQNPDLTNVFVLTFCKDLVQVFKKKVVSFVVDVATMNHHSQRKLTSCSSHYW